MTTVLTGSTLSTRLAPGKSRSRELPILARDRGHSIVEETATRRGASPTFTFALRCQCGKRMSSRQGLTALWYRLDAHRRAELGE